MRSMILRGLAGLMLATMLVGCVSKEAAVVAPRKDWQIGVTTRRDVVAEWGNPDKVEGRTWVWKDWRLNGGKVKASYMLVGITISSSNVATREQRLTFDENGVLVSNESVDSVPGGAQWTLNPW